mmetsp:Transcript_23130/g.52167  ORF Transcript_23130/g.52167 Transcript_23130/m.52167 type:complete len:234 (-) Transcript_23130:59-760(-)
MRATLLFAFFHGAASFMAGSCPPRALARTGRGSTVILRMFSGIVEEMGEVVSLTENAEMTLWDGSVGQGTELVVRSPSGIVLDGAYEGASIAINGVCTTVVVFDEHTFKVGLAPETLRRSNLGDLAAGERVNLERSLPADGRNSGHFVQGHVDCTGTILSKEPDGESLWIKVAAPPDLMRLVVPKGFIAIDGTSLTVCEVPIRHTPFPTHTHTQTYNLPPPATGCLRASKSRL